jgi:hypothetical protein
MSPLDHIRGSHFVDTPISVNSNGLIEINFTDTNVPRANHLKPWVLPKYFLVAKPMDLAIGTVAFTFVMTIKKCQGQSMNQVFLFLKGQVFAHGQLYVGLSCVKNVHNLFVTQVGLNSELLNVVVKRIINTDMTNVPDEEDVMVVD